MVSRPRQGMSPEQIKEQHARNEQQFHYSVNQTINSISGALESLQQRFEVLPQNLVGLKTDTSIQLENHQAAVSAELTLMRKVLDERDRRQDEFLEACEVIFRLIPMTYSTKDNFEAVKGKLEKSMSDMAEDHNRFKSDLNAVMHKLAMDYDLKLEKFKQEILGRPSEIPSLKKELLEKVDLIAMDGSNSLLRSTNNEKQIMLIEKKIENLYLMLKKIDLNLEKSSARE